MLAKITGTFSGGLTVDWEQADNHRNHLRVFSPNFTYVYFLFWILFMLGKAR